jgi:hypothetical protein
VILLVKTGARIRGGALLQAGWDSSHFGFAQTRMLILGSHTAASSGFVGSDRLASDVTSSVPLVRNDRFVNPAVVPVLVGVNRFRSGHDVIASRVLRAYDVIAFRMRIARHVIPSRTWSTHHVIAPRTWSVHGMIASLVHIRGCAGTAWMGSALVGAGSLVTSALLFVFVVLVR